MTEKRPAKTYGHGAATRRAPLHAGQARDVRAAFDAARQEDFFSPGWLLLFGSFIALALIFFLFTPYTHQLDEIKNSILACLPPFILGGLAWYAWSSGFLKRLDWRRDPATMFLGAYTLVMVVSWALNPYRWVGERVVWFQAGCATFTLVFAWLIDSESKLRKTMLYFTLLGLASTLLGLFLFAGQGFVDSIYASMASSSYWANPDRRPWVTLFYTLAKGKAMYSSVLNEDFYAAFLVMTIPIPVAMFFVERRLVFKVLGLITFLLMGFCLVFTNSNDSFMSMVIVVAAFTLLGGRYVRGWGLSRAFLWTFFWCALATVAVVAALMLPTLARTYEFKGDAIQGRIVLWSGGFWPWLYHHDPTRSYINPISFLWGTGPGGYRHYFPVFRRNDFFDNQINNVTTFGHNQYLDVLCETGLLGLVAFLGLYGTVLWKGFQQIRTTKFRTHRLYQIAVFSGLAGISVQNFFSPNYRWAVCGTIFWSMLGLGMGIRRLDDKAMAEAAEEGVGNPGTSSDATALAPRTVSLAPVDSTNVRQAAEYAFLAFAALFIIRSPWQGLQYFASAQANGRGLADMERAEVARTKTERANYLDSAVRNFQTAITINPTFITSYYKLAHVYNTLGGQDPNDRKATRKYLELAIDQYEALNTFSPHYSEIHQNLAIMYSQRAGLNAQEARDARTEGKSGADQPRTKTELEAAQRADLELSWTEAQEAARQSRKPNVQWLAATLGISKARFHEQRTPPENDKAMEIYERIKPYWRSIIEYMPKLEDLQQERLKYYPTAQTALVQLAEKTDKPDEAIEVLKRMVKDNPDDRTPLVQLMAAYDKTGRKADKVAYLQEAVHDDPLDVELRRLLADAHGATSDTAKRIAELRRIERVEPKDRSALTALYAHYAAAGPAEAAKAAEYRGKLTALGIDPDGRTSNTATAASAPPVAPAQPRKVTSMAPLAPTTASAPSIAEATATVPAATTTSAVPSPTPVPPPPTATTTPR